jgi:chromosomal replication initiation ATPase DnaA
MAVVTLNQLVFEQSVSVGVDRVASAVRELEQAADKVQARAGIVLAQEVRDCVASLRREMLKDMESASTSRPSISAALADMLSIAAVRKWIAVGLVFGAGLFSAGVWIGACQR